MDDAWIYLGCIWFVLIVCAVGFVAMLPGLVADVRAARDAEFAQESADWRDR